MTRGCAITLRTRPWTMSSMLGIWYLLWWLEVLNLEIFEIGRSWQCNICWHSFKLRNQGRHLLRKYWPWPFSKIWPRSTLTRARVWPCDLCIDKAHARIKGTWNRWASMLPLNPSTEKATGEQRSSLPFVKRTIGHRSLLENVLLLIGRKPNEGFKSKYSDCEAWWGRSFLSDAGIAIAIWRSKASRVVKNSITFPRLPLTRTPCCMFFGQFSIYYFLHQGTHLNKHHLGTNLEKGLLLMCSVMQEKLSVYLNCDPWHSDHAIKKLIGNICWNCMVLDIISCAVHWTISTLMAC